jgi:hypothetical protein
MSDIVQVLSESERDWPKDHEMTPRPSDVNCFGGTTGTQEVIT